MLNICEILKKLNKKALKNEDVPISCMIIKNKKIIAKTYNQRVKKNNPLAHAEILAIQKASKKLNTYNLSDCELYVTLKPCKMCEEIIKSAKIQKVYYFLDQNKVANNKINSKKLEDQNEYFYKELTEFFKDKR